MSFSLEIRNHDIEDSVARLKQTMPSEIKSAISLATQDLYSGPVYLNAAGEPCDCFDDGATQFDFKAACNTIRDWLDSNVSDIKIKTFYNKETEKPEYESVDYTAKPICEELIGKELLKTIYVGLSAWQM